MKRRSLLALGLSLLALCVGFIVVGVWRTWQALSPPPAAERSAYLRQTSDGPLPSYWPVPEFALRDQTGAPLGNRDLLGRAWVANFIFTSCTTVCPLLTAQFVVLQRQLSNPDLRFVSFSVDPENDSVEALARYAKQWNPDEPRWHLLASNPAQLEALARGMRVAVEPSQDTANPILHTSLFFLVASDGQVRGVYDSNDPKALADLARDASSLASSPSAPALTTAPTALTAAPDTAHAEGARLYRELGCAPCHENPNLAPSLAGLPGRMTELEDGTKLQVDAKYVREALIEPGKHVVAGYLKLMPSYRAHLSDGELDALVAHLMTASAGAGGAPEVGAGLAPTSSAAATANPAPTPTGARPAPKAKQGGGHDGPVPTATGVPAAGPTLGSPPSPAPASVVRDPVCGMKVRVNPETPHAEHAGKTYHFCATSCRKRFVENPGQFLQ